MDMIQIWTDSLFIELLNDINKEVWYCKSFSEGYVYSAGTGNGKIILLVPVMHCACSDQAWPDVEASSGNPQVVLDEFVYK